jgi:hypothetical protein
MPVAPKRTMFMERLPKTVPIRAIKKPEEYILSLGLFVFNV